MKKESNQPPQHRSLRHKLHEVIFEADTPAGKTFDVLLLLFIGLSVIAVILESVREIDQMFHQVFFYAEWVLTILFTVEYLLRIYSVRGPWKYISSFYGIVDLLAILPTYLSLLFAGSHYLLTIRALRLLRVFRVFKVARYLEQSQLLLRALQASRQKIIVFLIAVFTLVIIIGTTMYLIEGGQNSGFISIPRSMYWAVVTLTTVGFGDITPVTGLGQFLSAILMIMGYGIIAVPTGIVTAEIAQASVPRVSTQACPSCSLEGHAIDAKYCKYCGAGL